MTSAKLARVLGPRCLFDSLRAKRRSWEELISPYFITRCIQALFEIGFMDALLAERFVDAEQYARAHDLDPRVLKSICDALYARRILSMRKDGYFGLDKKGRFFAEEELCRGWFHLSAGYEPVLHNLENLLRGDVAYGRGVVRDPGKVSVGSGLASKNFYFPLLIDQIAAAGYRRTLDIGAGDGAFLRSLCSTVDGMSGIGVDLSPEAVALGREQVRAEGLDLRIQLCAGNALCLDELDPALAGVDAATCIFVLHELCGGPGHPRVNSFLRKFKAVMPGVPLHIVEPIRPTPEQMRAHPGPAIEYFLFHDLSNQEPLSRDHWKDLFHTAGFASIQENYLKLARTSIFTIQ